MNNPSPKMRELAACLIQAESLSAVTGMAAFRVCDKLAPELATLLGKSGYTAFLARAHALAVIDAPALKVYRVISPGQMQPVAREGFVPGAPELEEGGYLMVSHLISLLHAFVGDYFTLRIIRNGWPLLDLKNFDFED